MENKRNIKRMDGLVLHLCKRRLFNNQPDIEKYDGILFGFYDGLVLTHSERWSDFGPQKIDSAFDERVYKSKVSIKSLQVTERSDFTFSGVYPVKLLFPRSKCRKVMEQEYGFDFEIWENGKGISKDSPLFAALLLNVTKDFVAVSKDYNNLMEKAARVIFDKMKECSELKNYASNNAGKEMKVVVREFIKKYHCGLFHSIGYFDFALLFQCNNWRFVYELSDQLKCIKNDIPFLSNNYLLLGMSTEENAWEKIDDNAKCEMSIRINVRDGISVQEFCDNFDYKIKAKSRKENLECPSVWKKAKYYQISGYSDCIIMTDGLGMKYVLKEFGNDGIFQPSRSSNFFKSYISNIRTSFRKSININTNLGTQKECGFYNDPLIEDFNRANLKSWFDDNAYYRRINGFKQMLAQYRNIVVSDGQSSHAFDIEGVLKPAYQMLYKNLMRLHAYYNKSEEKIQYKDAICALLEGFRDYVGDFQDALQMSDRYFIESVRIRHPSVGSSTKLLIAYNQMINQLIEVANNTKNKYYFFSCLRWL